MLTKQNEKRPHSLEIREWAIRILSADSIDEKLLSPKKLTDFTPGPPLIWKEPNRPLHMQFNTRSKSEKLPPFHDHGDADKRAVCLHRFCGHELLAVEIMAYALLAFPEAPKNFRKGLANTLKEEQGHVRLYKHRLEEMGVEFGSMPLYRHFWAHVKHLTDPIKYVSTMSLTFEMANLDFAPMYRENFIRFGDEKSAKLMNTIFHDELSHVSFGWNWLKKFKGENETEWDAFLKGQTPLLTPRRAKGFIYHPEHRKLAGISEDFTKKLETSTKIPLCQPVTS